MGLYSVADYFLDPVLRAPTVGSMLMCFAASLIGVIVVLRKRSLLGETLSHAAYPGVVLSVILASLFWAYSEEVLAVAILIGAFLFVLLALYCLHQLQERFRVKSDAALCFVLSIFLGWGILIASRIQTTHALWYRQIQLYLYGQAATMTDIHIVIYGIFASLLLLIFFLLYREIEIVNFDRDFARSLGIRVSFVDSVLFILLALAIVIGIRSVGVVLMSGMLIAPAVTARQFTHRLSLMLLLAGFFGACSGFLGNYLSVELPVAFGEGLSLPTGPMILLSASTLCIASLFFAPGGGLVSRFVRIARFKKKCQQENMLKAFWKKGEESTLSTQEVAAYLGISSLRAFSMLMQLVFQGWLHRAKGGEFALTTDGQKRARHIVRLHRLWEVYLVYLGHGADKVHRNAEEMEHILTPELEKQLAELLRYPEQDPHAQPIPSKERL